MRIYFPVFCWQESEYPQSGLHAMADEPITWDSIGGLGFLVYVCVRARSQITVLGRTGWALGAGKILG